MQRDSGNWSASSASFDAAVTVAMAGIEGYASSLAPGPGRRYGGQGRLCAVAGAAADEGRAVKMLWQHDPAQPIGIWDEVREDEPGLYVKGRLLESVARGREAAALIAAGAIDGLSIGYRTLRR